MLRSATGTAPLKKSYGKLSKKVWKKKFLVYAVINFVISRTLFEWKKCKTYNF